jgi:hypothetical protein
MLETVIFLAYKMLSHLYRDHHHDSKNLQELSSTCCIRHTSKTRVVLSTAIEFATACVAEVNERTRSIGGQNVKTAAAKRVGIARNLPPTERVNDIVIDDDENSDDQTA